MKKYFGLLISIILVLPVLSGCFPEDSSDYTVSYFAGTDTDTIIVEFDYDLSAGPVNTEMMCNPANEKYEDLYGDMTPAECKKDMWEQIFSHVKYFLLNENEQELKTGVDVSCTLKDKVNFETEEVFCTIQLDKGVFVGDEMNFIIKALVPVGDVGESPFLTPVLTVNKEDLVLPDDSEVFEQMYGKFCQENPDSEICNLAQDSDQTDDVIPDDTDAGTDTDNDTDDVITDDSGVAIGNPYFDGAQQNPTGGEWVTTEISGIAGVGELPQGQFLADGGACSLNPNGSVSVFGIFFILFSLIGLVTERKQR